MTDNVARGVIQSRKLYGVTKPSPFRKRSGGGSPPARSPEPGESLSVAGFRVVPIALALLTVATPAQAAVRTVLLESFGSMSCADCADVRAAVTQLKSEFLERIVALEYHSSGVLASGSSLARADYYGSPTVPTTAFDGQDLTPGGGSVTNAYRALILSQMATPSPLLFDVVATFSEPTRVGSLLVEIEIDAGSSVPTPGEYRIRAAFVEDDVSECCGAGGVSNWSRVTRLLLPERPLMIGAPGEIQFEQYAAPLGAEWEVTNLKVIAWVQRDSDRSVLGATLALDGGSLQPVPVGDIDSTLVNLLQNQPNPLRRGQTRIPFLLPEDDWARLVVVNAQGREVRVLTDGPRNRGLQDVNWDGRDFRGRQMASGVYVYRLETSRGVQAKKMLILR